MYVGAEHAEHAEAIASLMHCEVPADARATWLRTCFLQHLLLDVRSLCDIFQRNLDEVLSFLHGFLMRFPSIQGY